MAKPKPPTPQELYRQRRLREEQERTAYLPPGLINHGNTCFMNSVLQGLIATQLLSDLVHFAPIPPAVQERSATLLAGQRSPQLTNGHNLSGPYDLPWVNTMPIGDIFLSVMYKAWDLQAKRQKDILSPRSILGALGKKYDQYLDFAQQDAHEFLRILLDAMRMEELDIIKKRQPPSPPAPKKRRRTTIVSSSLQSKDEPSPPEPPSLPEIPEEERLTSFADLIFGGKLTSILVCQKCKNISQTYEDFNDISLSIKPEDYTHRKRDKLKNFAKRLTAFPSTSTSNPAPFYLNAPEIQRPSSVPPSPKERPDGQLVPRDEPPTTTSARRRSLDIPSEARDSEKVPQVEEAAESTSKDHEKDIEVKTSEGGATPSDPNAATDSDSGHVLVNISGPEGKHIEFVEVSNKTDKKEKRKSQVEDNWAKLGRRLSLSVGLGKSKDRKSRSVDKPNRVSVGPTILEGAAAQNDDDSPAKRLSTESLTPRASLSGAVHALTGRTPSPDNRLFLSPKPPSADPPPPLSSESRRSPSPVVPSTSLLPNATPVGPPRSKSPKPPKATAAETEYLRKILADVSTGPANPLSTLFRPQSHPHLGVKGIGLAPHNVWLGINQLSGIEECLRMFTAVEVLDGENMVGCRRCWKIANGMVPKAQGEDADDSDRDSASASQDNAATADPRPSPSPPPPPPPPEHTKPTRPPLVPHLQTGGVHIPTSISTPTVSFYADAKEHEEASDTRSISSLPTASATSHHGSTSTTSNGSPRTSRTNSASSLSIESGNPGGLPIPVISLDEPDSTGTISPYSTVNVGEHVVSNPVNGIVAPKPTKPNHLFSNPHSDSKDSLPVPTLRRSRQQVGGTGGGGETTTTDDDDDSSADESDTSFATSVSAESVVSRASRSNENGRRPAPPGLAGDTPTPTNVKVDGGQKVALGAAGVAGVTVGGPASGSAANSPPKPPTKKTSKPKPVIMRPAYKRYLIATPPPVLVIHLKRFQQLAKSPFLSFSHGFKKLDDDITFPEHLDLTPFLAPKKEDYGLGKKKKKKHAGKDHVKGKAAAEEERCMYRLYAVVVHIGNMLGGHYIAYTALPTKSPLEGEGLATKKKKPDPAVAGAEGAQAASGSSGSVSSETPVKNGAGPASSSRSSTGTNPGTAATEQKPSQPRQWAYISDTIVRLTTLEEVLSAKAYICMYERV